MSKRPLGEILVDTGIVNRTDVEEALRQQKRQLGQILVDMGKLEPDQIDQALDVQSGSTPLATRYLGYLRATLAVLAVVILVGSVAMYQRVQEMRLRDLLDGAQLPPTQVLEFLRSGSSGERLDSLRSVLKFPRDDEKQVVLRLALKDEAWTVRLVAAVTARGEKLKDLVPDLVPLLMDSNHTVRGEGLQVLRDLTGANPGEDFKSWYAWGKAQGLDVPEPKTFMAPATNP